MRKVPTASYMNCAELDERASLLDMEATLLPIGKAKSELTRQAFNLRSYADMKRLLAVKRAS